MPKDGRDNIIQQVRRKEMEKSIGWYIGAVCMMVIPILLVVLFARHVNRLPDDWVGIGLYITAIILFICAILGFYSHWRNKE
jgi:EamA domain-containing membrane protein RarD